jgi:uncharacterized membrane protein/nitrite reductase/ring-hydroxylating ferredoxin subunit
MRSKAHVKGHPIHPILVCFPLAFYIGTLVFDSIALLKDDIAFALTGQYLHVAGIVAAVCAAIPGIIDYKYTVPPESSARKRATTHALVNSSVLILFCVALYCKHIIDLSPYVVIAVEFTGVVLTGYAGWLGGTLVHKNQIGVDVRYASSGKWKELYLDENVGRIEVGTSDELKIDQMKLIHAKDKRIVLARTAEGYVAFDDRCPHKGGSLAGGMMICGTVQCPGHGSQFDVNSGRVKAGPSEVGINHYQTLAANGKVYLLL